MPTYAIPALSTALQEGDGNTPVETFTTIAEIKNIGGPKLAAETKEVSSHSSGGWKEFITTLMDGGEIALSLNFIPTSLTQGYQKGMLWDMVQRIQRHYRIVFPDAAGTTWSFNGYVSKFDVKANTPDPLEADVTIRVTGAPVLQ